MRTGINIKKLKLLMGMPLLLNLLTVTNGMANINTGTLGAVGSACDPKTTNYGTGVAIDPGCYLPGSSCIVVNSSAATSVTYYDSSIGASQKIGNAPGITSGQGSDWFGYPNSVPTQGCLLNLPTVPDGSGFFNMSGLVGGNQSNLQYAFGSGIFENCMALYAGCWDGSGVQTCGASDPKLYILAHLRTCLKLYKTGAMTYDGTRTTNYYGAFLTLDCNCIVPAQGITQPTKLFWYNLVTNAAYCADQNNNPGGPNASTNGVFVTHTPSAIVKSQNSGIPKKADLQQLAGGDGTPNSIPCDNTVGICTCLGGVCYYQQLLTSPNFLIDQTNCALPPGSDATGKFTYNTPTGMCFWQ